MFKGTPYQRVLVVDDDPVARELHVALLRRILGTDVEIATAASAEATLRLIMSNAFDLYLVDYLLEKNRTGLEVVAAVRQRQPDVPVIVLTGVQEEGKDLELIQRGASDFLEKERLTVKGLERSLQYARERQRFAEERTRLEGERKSLQDAVQSLEEVVGVVAHELRTPLAGMQVMAELGLESESVDTLQSALRGVLAESRRLSGVVNNLLEVTQYHSGKVNWDWQRINLSRCVEEALRSIQPLVSQSKVELIVDGIDKPCMLNGDEIALTRLVHNLVINAVKFTEVGHVHVSIREHEETLSLVVQDTGIGISEEVLQRLGEGFRLSAANVGSAHIQGSGFGFAIVKGIVGAHGGFIRLSSRLGVGTTVEVEFPKNLPLPSEEPCRIIFSEKERS